MRAKIYFARVVTLPAPLAAWSAGILCGAVSGSYALPLLAECLWLWWVVSTLAGRRFYLFHNDGRGHFVDQAVARGVALVSNQPHVGFSVNIGTFAL